MMVVVELVVVDSSINKDDDYDDDNVKSLCVHSFALNIIDLLHLYMNIVYNYLHSKVCCLLRESGWTPSMKTNDGVARNGDDNDDDMKPWI